MKNKQGRLYKLGELDVPDKFGYLKTNASKHNPRASRTAKSTNTVTHSQKGTGRAMMMLQTSDKEEARGCMTNTKKMMSKM